MSETESLAATAEFAVSQEPRISAAAAERSTGGSFDGENLSELPRTYGGQTLVAIARDPHTIFVYWDIDWPLAFQAGEPADHKVHVRTTRGDAQESIAAVEPMAGSSYITVTNAAASYRTEIGYFHPAGNWNSVAVSEPVMTPADRVGDATQTDFATVPLHLSFQRMIDLFRISKYDSASLLAVVARLQKRPRSDAGLSSEDAQLLRFMDRASEQLQQLGLDKSAAESLWNREQLEAILGINETNSASRLGGSSRAS